MGLQMSCNTPGAPSAKSTAAWYEGKVSTIATKARKLLDIECVSHEDPLAN